MKNALVWRQKPLVKRRHSRMDELLSLNVANFIALAGFISATFALFHAAFASFRRARRIYTV